MRRVPSEDLTFRPHYVSMTAKDCETLYWLIQESGLDEAMKDRLTRKMNGVYLSDETEARGRRAQKRNREERSLRLGWK